MDYGRLHLTCLSGHRAGGMAWDAMGGLGGPLSATNYSVAYSSTKQRVNSDEADWSERADELTQWNSGTARLIAA